MISVGDFIARSKERSYAVAKEAGLDPTSPDLILTVNLIAAAEAEAYVKMLHVMEHQAPSHSPP